MSVSILGIDIAKQSYQVSLLVDGKVYRREFRNQAEHFEELCLWLQKHGVEQCQVCMEATNIYWEELARFLYQRGDWVSVINPARIRHYAKSKLARNKTDQLDADLIADFCSTQNPVLWEPPSPEIRELQALMRHLEDLKSMRSEVSTRLSNGVSSEAVQKMLQEHLDFIDQQIEALKKQIQAHIDQNPGLKQQLNLLVSIPGIGELTAAKLLSENIQSFDSTRSLTAYAGLNPQLGNSGTSVRQRPRLSKIGNAHLRKALYFPAVNAMRYNPTIQVFCNRLKQRDKHNMTIIGACMHKLLCLSLGVLKSGLPFDPNYHATSHTTS